jgi:hypothetical protein
LCFPGPLFLGEEDFQQHLQQQVLAGSRGGVVRNMGHWFGRQAFFFFPELCFRQALLPGEELDGYDAGYEDDQITGLGGKEAGEEGEPRPFPPGLRWREFGPALPGCGCSNFQAEIGRRKRDRYRLFPF